MKRNTALKVPYSSGGDLLHSIKPIGGVDPIGEWRSNDVFEATLRFKGTERGRSAAFFRWEDTTTGAVFPMFITDMGHLVMQARPIEPGGTVSGRWFVVKRGQNYGITPEETPRSGQERPVEATEDPAAS